MGAGGQPLLILSADGLIGPYPVVGLSMAFGSTGGGESQADTIATASALIILNAAGARGGAVEAGDLYLGLNDTTATITTEDTNEGLSINPNGTGQINIGTDANARNILLGTGIATSRVRFFDQPSAPTLSNNGEFALGSNGTGLTAGRLYIRSNDVTYTFNSDNNADYSEFLKQNPTGGSELGDVLVIDPAHSETVTKTQTSYDPGVIGVVTGRGTGGNNPNDNRQFDANYANVGLLGQVFTKVSTENGAIASGDFLTTSSAPGVAMKATRVGRVVGRALEDYREYRATTSSTGAPAEQILVMVNASWYDPSTALPLSQVTLGPTSGLSTAPYAVTDPVGKLITTTSVFSDSVIGNLRTGLVTAKEVAADNITIAGQTLSDYIKSVVKQEISQMPQTSPIGESEKPAVTFDNLGNATLAGTLSAPEVTTGNLEAHDASIAGTLYADRIVTRFGDLDEELSVLRSQLSASDSSVLGSSVTSQPATGSAEVTPTPTPMLTLAPTSLSPPPLDASASALLSLLSLTDTATASAVPINQEITINASLLVLGTTNLGQTTVAGPLITSGPLQVGGEGLEGLGGTLYIQKNKLANVDILSGTLVVNTQGSVLITGDLSVTGSLAVGGVLGVNTISAQGNDLTISDFGKLLVRSGAGPPVVTIDSSGSAVFSGNVTASGSGTFSRLAVGAKSSAVNVPLSEGATQLSVASISAVTTSYAVYVVPSWNTTTWISGKTTSGFTINFGTPAPVGATVDWFMIEKEGG